MIKHISQRVSEDISQQVSESMSQQVSEGTSQQVSEGRSQHMSEGTHHNWQQVYFLQMLIHVLAACFTCNLCRTEC